MTIQGCGKDYVQRKRELTPGASFNMANTHSINLSSNEDCVKVNLSSDEDCIRDDHSVDEKDWEYKFMGKYVTVRTIKRTIPEPDAPTSDSLEATNRDGAKPTKNGQSEGVLQVSKLRCSLQKRPRLVVMLRESSYQRRPESYCSWWYSIVNLLK
ncbi:hypothetical protein NE237_033295 [Protea cynaroides]|uniref:Uncharacterized protein n=1 Tax=Protea cynaroides TaxID=273540 RepID=A0A9Q0L4L6_9MAGN|nr:hypothetical protein NE237_033295 [Protea cynaroides]